MNFNKFSLKTKIMLPVAVICILIVASLSVIVGKRTYDNAAEDANKIMAQTAGAEGERMEQVFAQVVAVAKTSAGSILGMKRAGFFDRNVASEMVHGILKNNKFIVGTCYGLEPNSFDSKDAEYANKPGYDATGRFIPYWSRSGDVESLTPLADYDKEGAGDYYLIPKKNKKTWVMPPYLYPVNGVNILMTSAIEPLLFNEKFVGIVGVDVDLKDIQAAVKNIKPFQDSEAYLLTNELQWVTHKDEKLITKNAELDFDRSTLLSVINENKQHLFSYKKSSDGIEYVAAAIPVTTGPEDKPWVLYVETPKATVMASAKATIREQMVISSLAMVILLGMVYWISQILSNKIGEMSKQMNESVGVVSGAIAQLNDAGQSLSQASSTSAASVEETVASLEEITSMVKMNADNAKQAAALAVSSTDAATRGEVEVKKLITSMQNISDSSRQIEEIISVIDNIAFQTNLLALNAAVEAARAGEQGKGFAVVADAVRALAQKSAEAAKNISSLIQDSVSKVQGGVELANKNGETLHLILQSIKKVSDLNNEIATASDEQATGIQQISSAMNHLDQSVQSNAASSEEIAATATEINDQARIMNNLVENMSSTVFGDKKAA